MEHLIDAVVDTLRIFPFLFLVYLFLEYIEHNLTDKWQNIIQKSSKSGPLWGSILGIFPQCGFASMATSLYVTRVIGLGTLISIFLATSDEMLPILISRQSPIGLIITILIIKVVVGIIFGFIIDFVITKKKQTIEISPLCEGDNCHCEDGNSIFKSALIHSLKIAFYILVVTLILNIAISMFDIESLLNNSNHSIFISALIGLIPNCASSIVLTELYLQGVLNFAGLMAGLLTNAGIGLLVLFKLNKKIKENLFIVGLLYTISIMVGFIILLTI